MVKVLEIRINLYKLLIILLCAFGFFSCAKEQAPKTLQEYIDNNEDWLPFNELIACAASAGVGEVDAGRQLSVFFYPGLHSTNFRYYETDNADADPSDLNAFNYIDLDSESLFNTFMRRYLLPKPSEDKWVRLSFLANDTLWYCKPILIKSNAQPTEYNNLLISVDQTDKTHPRFNWDDGTADDNIIYFQLIIDNRNDAISATYTTEKTFQYYNTDNVVLNVTRPGAVPDLISGETYRFVLMGVSGDNWVNLLFDFQFVVG